MTARIVMYGASGQARGLDCIFTARGQADVVAFIDDFEGGKGKTFHGRPVITFEQWRDERLPVFISVGKTSAKRRLAEKVAQAGGRLANIHAAPEFGFVEVRIGVGTAICLPAYIGPSTVIGDNVQVMPMSSVGHDVIIGDHCTLCPSSTISGYVVIEDGVFVGGGATIINGRPGRPLVIGRDSTIAVGSVVTKALPAGSTVMGNPARPLRELARARRRD